MKYFVTVGERTLEVDLTGETPVVDGVPMHAELVSVPGTTLRHLLVGGHSMPLEAEAGDRRGRWHLGVESRRIIVDAVDERTRTIREMTGGAAEEAEREVSAPMPGMVVRVEVEEGQHVQAGQGVVVVEAMKMENELTAPVDGVVAQILVTAGQAVEKGAVLLVLE